MGFGQDAANVYFLDLGISKQYRDYMKKNHGRVGNARYASLNSHLYRGKFLFILLFHSIIY
jgi:hypothetical protein